MQTFYLAVLLAGILALLCEAVQQGLRRALQRRPALVFLAPPILTAIFLLASLSTGTWNGELILIVFAYTLAPTVCARTCGDRARTSAPARSDFAAILLLRMPLEFPAGAAQLIAKHAQGFLHSVAYGVAILLGLILFLGFRAFPGMKYNPPRGRRDLTLTLVAYAVTAPVLMVVGIWMGFIPPPHSADCRRRQNGRRGRDHLCGYSAARRDSLPRNDPEPADAALRPRRAHAAGYERHLRRGASGQRPAAPAQLALYMILAIIAGYAYGKVFERSRTILSSTLLHCMVDWTKHFFF